MIGFFDRDVFIKLACCDLGLEAVECLGIALPYRLPSVTRSSSARIVRKTFQEDGEVEDALGRVESLCQSVSILPASMIATATDSDAFEALDLEEVDIGERILASLVADTPASQILLTGDKRFIRALARGCPSIWSAISNSVITFEMCLDRICANKGHEFAMRKALPARRCDISLASYLHQGSTVESFKEGLRYYADLRL